MVLKEGHTQHEVVVWKNLGKPFGNVGHVQIATGVR